MAVSPVPEGYQTVTPYLVLRHGSRAIAFYKEAFLATELFRMDDGERLLHAELQIGDSRIMLADEDPDRGFVGPETLNGSTVSLLLYVEDVDEWFSRAIAAGAKELMPVSDQFYGDRSGTLVDPFGHLWTIATRTEDLTPDELRKRSDAALRRDRAA